MPLRRNHPRKARREKIGLTREDMASLVGVTLMTIYRWETGRVIPARAMDRAWEAALAAAEQNERTA